MVNTHSHLFLRSPTIPQHFYLLLDLYDHLEQANKPHSHKKYFFLIRQKFTTIESQPWSYERTLPYYKMNTSRVIGQSVANLIRLDAQHGLSTKQLVKKYGRDRKTIGQILLNRVYFDTDFQPISPEKRRTAQRTAIVHFLTGLGFKNADIGQYLGVSPQTASYYRSRLRNTHQPTAHIVLTAKLVDCFGNHAKPGAYTASPISASELVLTSDAGSYWFSLAELVGKVELAGDQC